LGHGVIFVRQISVVEPSKPIMPSYRTLLEGASEEVDSGNSMDQIPEWMDVQKFNRGRDFFRRHFAAATFALHTSVLLQFSFDALLRCRRYTIQIQRCAKCIR